MCDALVHVNDVRIALADQSAQLSRAVEIELIPHPQSHEVDACFSASNFERVIGSADDSDGVTTLAQSGRGLEHLVHRAGVELVELENVEDAHGGCCRDH
ncbi:MAG: hypothetical protein DMF59_01385 [Acidobacteria bacterium]|nr:MAG: hypothetical protein DMF59_01385 [Acidobacteriota bacterium]